MDITQIARAWLVRVALVGGGLASLVGSGGGGGGGGGSDPPAVTAPTITTQPQSQTVSAGSSVAFTVVASGSAPLAYQWQRDGAAIGGATSATLALVAGSGDNGAVFRVVVSNAGGAVTSNGAALTVGSTGVGTLNGIGVSAGDASVWMPVTASVPGRPAATSTAVQSFNLQGVPASERVILRNVAAGHVDQVKVAAVRAGAVTFVRSTLWPAAAASTLDPAAGGSVGIAGSAGQLVLPAGVLRRVDNGALPTGAVSIVATALPGAQDPDRLPGDFLTPDAGVDKPFESLGAVAISATDASGQPLQLAAGRQAQLRIPVSSRDTAALPATAAVYALDESSARWAAAGTGTQGGSGNARYYAVDVSTLGTFSAGRLIDTVRVIGCTQAASTRTRNRVVRAEAVAATFAGYAFTGADGSFSVPIPRNQAAVLYTFGSVESSLPIVVGPSATDITLGACRTERGTDTAVPGFVVQPLSQSVATGAVVRLSAVLDGKLPMGLQWRRNGVAIAGETGNTLVFAAGAGDNGAVFTLQATNATGSTTSADAVLTVSGGAVGGGGGAGACNIGMPPEGTRFQATHEIFDAGVRSGTMTTDLVMRGTAVFEGVSARYASSTLVTSITSGGVTADTTTLNDSYANVTASGELTRYGQQGSYTTAHSNGFRSAGTTKVVFTPPWVDRTDGLAVGGSTTTAYTMVTSGTRDGVVQPVLSMATSQTTTLMAVETVVVPAGSFETCKVVYGTGPSASTVWVLPGVGGMVKMTTGTNLQQATAVTVTRP